MADGMVSSGIGPLDRFLGGGLPAGFTTLLLAPTGSGVELFAKQFAANHEKERVTFVTTDEPSREILRTVEHAGWKFNGVTIMDLQEEFVDRVLDSQRKNADTRTRSKGSRRFDPRDLVEGTDSRDLIQMRKDSNRRNLHAEASGDTNYLENLLAPYTQLRVPDRMVVDSLDFFLNLYSVEEVVTTLHALKAANAKAGGELLLILSKGAHDSTTERRLELMADCLIELEMTRKGTSFERFFMVKKVKNRSRSVGVSTYEVTDSGFELETLERIV